MVIEVSIPSSMVMLPNFPVETVVGSHLQAAVTMKVSNGDCRAPDILEHSISCHSKYFSLWVDW